MTVASVIRRSRTTVQGAKDLSTVVSALDDAAHMLNTVMVAHHPCYGSLINLGRGNLMIL